MDDNLRAFIKQKMDENIQMVPEHMRDGFYHYVLDRIEPGGFMAAVLANDLKGAVTRADHINKRYLVDIVNFVIWSLPSGCQGSYEKINQWLSDDKDRGTEPICQVCQEVACECSINEIKNDEGGTDA